MARARNTSFRSLPDDLLLQNIEPHAKVRRVKKKTHSNRPPLASTSCSSVIVVDSRPVREKARREYEKVLRDLEKAREQLRRFESEDVPAFRQWFHARFGKLLTELRETHQQLLQKTRMLDEIEMEMIYHGASPERAFQKVSERQKEAGPAADAEPEEPGAKRSGHFHQGGNFHDRRLHSPRNGKTDEKKRARLKEIYRVLARKLHPDSAKNHSAKHLEWWHQAQAAYERGEVEQLEIILTLCDIEDRGSVAHTSLSILMRITSKFKETLRQVRSQLASCRREPAWNFRRREDMETMAARVGADIEEELAMARRQLEKFNIIFERLEASSRSRRRKRPVSDWDPLESWF